MASFFNEFELQGSALVAKDTGARIPITPGFFVDLAKGASFVGLVQALRASRLLKGRAPRARIAFFPQQPRSYYAIWPVCQLADVKIVANPAEADLFFYFEDREFLTAARTAPAAETPVFNGDCIDIRKSRVSRAFEEVFGYALDIDPTTHVGPVVEKSEKNGVHDGRIVECPIKTPKKGCVYQRLIDNTFDGRDYVDIRTPVVGGQIPIVYLKRRDDDGRFSNDNRQVDLVSPQTMFSPQEIEKIGQFADTMNLDFGGLDILRDRNDGRIYIVDVNKTDMGPPTALSGAGKLAAMRGLASAFSDLVDRRLETLKQKQDA